MSAVVNAHLIKPMIKGMYDAQKLRIQVGLRIVASFKHDLAVDDGEENAELEGVIIEKEELPKKASDLMKALLMEHRLITDAIASSGVKVRSLKPELFRQDGIKLISNETEYQLLKHYNDLLTTEKDLAKYVTRLVKENPLYTEYLEQIPGMGPIMAGVIMTGFDISKARYASSLWAYAGLDVVNVDGVYEGRSKKAAHLVDKTYVDKKGKITETKGITFNSFLKTKMVGVLGPSFVRSKKGKYREVYDNYKHRLQNRPDLVNHSKGHINNMTIRYTVKMFLLELYAVWRKMDGLPVHEPYHVAKLGLSNHLE